jgi:hypothetical protein
MMTGQHFDSGGLSLLGLVDGYAKALVNHGAATLSNLLVPEWTSGDERGKLDTVESPHFCFKGPIIRAIFESTTISIDMKLHLLLICFSFAIHCASFAGNDQSVPEHIGNAVLLIPAGLDSADRKMTSKSSELHVYLSRKDSPQTHVQLTHTTTPEASANLPDSVKYAIASSVLSGLLHPFGNDMQDWQHSSIEPVQLGGHVAARANWTANSHGIPTRGTMYFITMERESYCFHVFGQSNIPNQALDSTIQAIEQLRFENP